MDPSPIPFPVDSQDYIFSFILDVQTDNPEALIKSIKKLSTQRETCKYFDAIIKSNIPAWLALTLKRQKLKITDICDLHHNSVLLKACLEKIDTPILSTILLQAAQDDALTLIEMKDGTQCSPLYYATMRKNRERMKVLLTFAKDQAPMIILMKNGEKASSTALREAILKGDVMIVKILLDAAGAPALQEIIEREPEARKVMESEHLYLDSASISGSQDMVDLLRNYREKYENKSGLCQDLNNNFVLKNSPVL